MNHGRNTQAALWDGRIWDSVTATATTGAMPQATTMVIRSPSDTIVPFVLLWILFPGGECV